MVRVHPGEPVQLLFLAPMHNTCTTIDGRVAPNLEPVGSLSVRLAMATEPVTVTFDRNAVRRQL